MLAAREAIMQTEDEQLTARCRAGDSDAFSLLYARYERQVFRYAYHLLGHREDADDIKQETFLRAFKAIGGFRSDASLQTWLFKICGNLCRDRLRSWERRQVLSNIDSVETAQQAAPDSDPHLHLEREEQTALLARALRLLTSAQREIIVLRDVEGLGYAQIAPILGCSTVSAKLRAYRARNVLKARVQALLDTPKEE
jgi:RNA polymerase sigma-70 factor (ECF subfamily)